MDSVGVRELRQNLSVYLRRVDRGERLRVLSRGRPVAVLGPIQEEPRDWYEQMVEEGRLIPPQERWETLPEAHPAPPGWDSQKVLDEIRADRI